jgi:hypothetical protein
MVNLVQSHLNICSTKFMNTPKGAAHRNIHSTVSVRCTFGTWQFRFLQILGSSAAFIHLTMLLFGHYTES